MPNFAKKLLKTQEEQKLRKLKTSGPSNYKGITSGGLDQSVMPLSEQKKRYTFHDVSAKPSQKHREALARESKRDNGKQNRQARCPGYKALSPGNGQDHQLPWGYRKLAG